MLRDRGYETIAAHGFLGSTFSRESWYPAIGFDEVAFAHELRRRETGTRQTCGVTFRGICDSDILPWLNEKLASHRDDKLFLYWLTLNGHLPVEEPTEISTDIVDQTCSPSQPLAENRSACWLVHQHRVTLSAVATLARNPELPPTAFVIVGDHMPPFATEKYRTLFRSDVVPYIILWPKDMTQPPHQSQASRQPTYTR